jgi:protein-S-isoprenylcysteine O-methyltransferase Ste14
MLANSLQFLRDRSGRLRDLAGFAFFAFAALVSIASAWDHPSILAWLYACHNGLLAFFYARRQPAKSYDRTGLWLGMIAAFLPTFSTSASVPGIIPAEGWYFLVPALAGYGLILWSLFTLGTRFGIAPADRGLTCRGPYRILRHPMYLGELIFRVAMVFCSPNMLFAGFMAFTLVVIQCWRIRREEKMIAGYTCYSRVVLWRLVPGLW